MNISSIAFSNNEIIPFKYTYDGENINPSADGHVISKNELIGLY